MRGLLSIASIGYQSLPNIISHIARIGICDRDATKKGQTFQFSDLNRIHVTAQKR